MSDTSANPLRAGSLMIGAALLALLWANSPLAAGYVAMVNQPAPLGLGPLLLDKTLGLWVNDALMALFFLLIGVEIKREWLQGSLATPRQALLPAAAALGGMVVPALLFVLVNRGQTAALDGWAIPCATDIAFSLAVLRLVAPRAPPSLAVFLMALAVIDDLGAIVIIAMFYAASLSPVMLAAALVPLAALLALNRGGVTRRWPYLLAGAVLWLCVLKSGVHATIAGVLIALAMPLPTGTRVEHALKPVVDYGVLPLFALFNAGVALNGGMSSLAATLPLGIMLGLVAGKTLGVTLGVAVARLATGAALPSGTRWIDMIGVAAVAGIGFTMSLFIAALAFEAAAPALFEQAKLGVLAGSASATLLAAAILRLARYIK